MTGPLLDEQIVVSIIHWMGESISLCQKAKLELVAQFRKLEEFDEEKKDEFQEEYEQLNELLKRN